MSSSEPLNLDTKDNGQPYAGITMSAGTFLVVHDIILPVLAFISLLLTFLYVYFDSRESMGTPSNE